MAQASPQPGSIPMSAPALGVPDVLRILRKRVWLLVACIIVLGIGGTAGLVAWYFYVPTYSATGIINIVAYQGERGGGPFPNQYADVIPSSLYEQYMMNQVLVIESDAVLRQAIDALGLEQNIYKKEKPEELSKELSVAYLPRSQNIAVTLSGRNPVQIQTIVRGVLDAYIKFVKTQNAQTEADRQRDLTTERNSLTQQADELNRRLMTFLRESGAAALEGRSEEMGRLEMTTRQLVLAQGALADAKAQWEYFQQLAQQAEQEKNQAAVFVSYPAIGDELRRSPSIISQATQVVRLGQDLASLKQRLGPSHEVVKRAEQLYQAAKNDLEVEQARVVGELLQQQGAVLKADYERARDAEAAVSDQVATARADAARVALRAAEYQGMQREYQRVQTLLDTVLTGLAQMRIQSALVRPNTQITQYPTPPDQPSEPKLLLYIPAVVLFSIALGIGLSMLLEFMDTKIRTPAQIVRQLGVPLLGSIPDVAEDERLSLGSDLSQVSQVAPQSLMAEAFRQFRTNLRFASDRALKSILVTSPNAGDGKTVTAVNLAIAMARGGSKVLLVEANFRRPALARSFDVPDRVGLSNVLVGLNQLNEAVQATRVENLSLLVGGPPPPSPADLLGSERMRRLLQEAAAQYDHIVIDAAPVLLVADAHLLTEAVDGVVLVFRAGENTRGLALRAARQILDLRARLLGAVLNGVRATRGGYFRAAYQAYYDYAGPGPRAVLSRASAARPQDQDFPMPPAADAQAAQAEGQAPAAVINTDKGGEVVLLDEDQEGDELLGQDEEKNKG